MARSKQEFIGSEPNVEECRTEHLAGNFSRCLTTNTKCMYAYPAGSSCIYCLHQNNRKFERRAFAGSPSSFTQRA